jgi:hypothetical protein
MDPAIALVQAYLRVNGYFTVTDYPLFETRKGGDVRAVTDLDLLGFRLGRDPGHAPHGESTLKGIHRPDATLIEDPGAADMIVAEVKGGTPRFNEATLDPRVLGAALVGFGRWAPDEAAGYAQALLTHGRVRTSDGTSIRIIAFGSGEFGGRAGHAYRTISLGHVVGFLEDYLREEWDVLRQVDIREPGLGMLQLLMKARAGA